MKWCELYLSWRAWKQNNVIWTDEKIFRTNPQGKKIKAKILFDEAEDQVFLPMKQQGGGGVIFWGAISSHGKIHFTNLKGKIDSEVFTDFLKEEALPAIENSHGGRYILQQDNAPPHKGETTTFLSDSKIEVFEWPLKSPDLNPIEQVWLWMATKLRGVTFKNVKELEPRVFELWEEIPDTTIFAYIEKIKDKALWVLQNNGDLYPDHE